MSSLPSSRSRVLYAVAGAAVVILLLAVALGAYRGSFTSTYEITVRADRTGLGLDRGASVTYRGVAVGRVISMKPGKDDDVELQVALLESTADAIPSSVTATIDSSTFFGPKTVELVAPQNSGEDVLAAGAVVPATTVSPEFNGLFDQAHSLLTAVDVGDLNAALSAIAQTLDGRGDELGRAVTEFSGYVEVVNAHLPAIEEDIRLGRRVLNQYDEASDDLLGTIDNASAISETLVEVRPTLGTFLLSLTRSVDNLDLLVRRAGPPFTKALSRLRPTLAVLDNYAPMLTCTIKGMNEARKLAETVIGNKIPAAQANVEFLPGQRPYRFEDSLPKLVTGVGPHCYGLPVMEGKELDAPHYLFDDGTIPVWTSSEGDEVAPSLDSLFGSNLHDLLGIDGGPSSETEQLP